MYYLIIGIILAVVSTIFCKDLLANAITTAFSITDAGEQKKIRTIVLIVNAVLFLVLWRVYIYLFIIIIAAIFIYEKIIKTDSSNP